MTEPLRTDPVSGALGRVLGRAMAVGALIAILLAVHVEQHRLRHSAHAAMAAQPHSAARGRPKRVAQAPGFNHGVSDAPSAISEPEAV